MPIAGENGMRIRSASANIIVNMQESTGRKTLSTAESVTENGGEKSGWNILKKYGSGRKNITKSTKMRLMPRGEHTTENTETR